jgi:hypothetical protein
MGSAVRLLELKRLKPDLEPISSSRNKERTMRKVIFAVFAVSVLILAIPLYGYTQGEVFVAAYGGGHYGGGHYGGGHYGGGHYGGGHYWGGHHGGGHSGNSFYWGGSIWLGPGYPYGPWYPYGWGYPYPYYAGPPVVIQQQPPVYSQREQPEPDYWYYCQNPQGYYPYIKNCPGGWMKVVPEPPK